MQIRTIECGKLHGRTPICPTDPQPHRLRVGSETRPPKRRLRAGILDMHHSTRQTRAKLRANDARLANQVGGDATSPLLRFYRQQIDFPTRNALYRDRHEAVHKADGAFSIPRQQCAAAALPNHPGKRGSFDAIIIPNQANQRRQRLRITWFCLPYCNHGIDSNL